MLKALFFVWWRKIWYLGLTGNYRDIWALERIVKPSQPLSVEESKRRIFNYKYTFKKLHKHPMWWNNNLKIIDKEICSENGWGKYVK